MEEFMIRIESLSLNNFTQTEITAFLETYPPSVLVTQYLYSPKVSPSQYDKILEALDMILQNPTVFRTYFLEETKKREIEEISEKSTDEVQEILSRALIRNKEACQSYLIGSINSNKKAINEAFEFFFSLFFSDSTLAFTNLKKLFYYFGKIESLQILASEDYFWNRLKTVLTDTNSQSVHRMRVFELSASLSSISVLDNFCYDFGLYDAAAKLYPNCQNDLLEKLNYVEILKQFDPFSRMNDVLKESGLMNQFQKEALQENTDLCVRRDLMIVLLNFMALFALENEQKVFEVIFQQMEQLLAGKDEVKSAGFEIAVHVFLFIEALGMCLSSKITVEILQRRNQLPEYLKLKASSLLVEILTGRKVSHLRKERVQISHELFAQVLVHFFGDSSEESDEQIVKTISRLLKETKGQFKEDVLDNLKMVNKLVSFKEMIPWMLKSVEVRPFAIGLLELAGNDPDIINEKRSLRREWVAKLKELSLAGHPLKEQAQVIIGILSGVENKQEFEVANLTYD